MWSMVFQAQDQGQLCNSDVFEYYQPQDRDTWGKSSLQHMPE